MKKITYIVIGGICLWILVLFVSHLAGQAALEHNKAAVDQFVETLTKKPN